VTWLENEGRSSPPTIFEIHLSRHIVGNYTKKDVETVSLNKSRIYFMSSDIPTTANK
jgi:hypothetical protein